MQTAEIPKLNEEQLRYFDTEFVTPEMWVFAERWFREAFPEGRFSFLDIGGGNGCFTDSLLERFPNSTGVLIDNGEALVSANKPHPRKTVLLESALELERRFGGQRFDLVCFNWVLHHLVTSSYESTCRLQAEVLAGARSLLSARGRICIFENLYDGAIVDSAPGWMIYQLTSSTLLSPIVKQLGANSAGCGVCFRSSTQWESVFRQAHLKRDHFQRFHEHPINGLRRLALHIGSARNAGYLMSPDVRA
jgi:Predicted O-methyltransferase